MARVPRIDSLVEFLAVVDAGSVSATARNLDIPRATLSRRISALEASLQTRLLHRDSRQMGLTHAGELLAEHARGVVASAEEAVLAVQSAQHEPTGRLRISMPPVHLFQGLLVAFKRAYPALELQLVGTPAVTDLVAEGVDVAIRAGTVRNEGLIARRLWTDRTSIVASRDYLGRHGRPSTPDDLAGHSCLRDYERTWRPRRAWPLREGGTVPVDGSFTCHDAFMRLHLALAGDGLALLPDGMTQPYVDSGQLERLLTEEVGGTLVMSIVLPERKYMPSAVRAFLDFTVDYYGNGRPSEDRRPAPRELPVVTIERDADP
jgi:DNA-binding transcriptional LysR family regulator